MRWFQEVGADVNAYGGSRGTVLLAALGIISFHAAEKIEMLSGWGADSAISGPNDTFTQLAARHSDPNIQKLVLNSNTILESSLLDEALVLAAASSEIPTMMDLIERDADVNANASFFGMVGSPIEAALTIESEDTLAKVQVLLVHGVSPNLSTMEYSDVL